MQEFKVTLLDHEGTAHYDSGVVTAENAKAAAFLFAQARGYRRLDQETSCSDRITTWMAVSDEGGPQRAALVVAIAVD